MTNEELQELEKELKSIDKQIKETDDDLKTRWNLNNRRNEIQKDIREEMISRTIEGGMPEFKRLAIELVNTGMSTTRETKQLWMVKFGDRWFKSEKGKLTWTSEEHNIDTVTIAFESVFWWIYLFMYVFFGPILICEFIIRKYHEKHNH